MDAKNDLNVYTTAKEPSGCGGGSQANVPCCGTSTNVGEKDKASLKGIDFNEWAGMSSSLSPSLSSFLDRH